MRVLANGLMIEVSDEGPPNGEPLLMIMGLGMQLVAWPEPFVERLIEQGFRVIRFDNRDIGLSQGFDEMGTPNLVWQGLRHGLRLPVKSPYQLDDMADDAAGVLTALGIPSAHVVGASMGGMIAQLLALQHPTRVKSMTLIMTSSGSRNLPGPTAAARLALLAPHPDDGGPQAVVDHMVKTFKVIGSPSYPHPEDELRARIERAVLRAYRPAGVARQLTAIAAARSRRDRLRGLRHPTRVIHGKADPLVPIAHGLELVEVIPEAELTAIDGMGHDLPPQMWSSFAAAIRQTAERHRA